MAKILAAKPHSADMERLNSTNNIPKMNLRNCLNLETENLYKVAHRYTKINLVVLKNGTQNLLWYPGWQKRAGKSKGVKEHLKDRLKDWFKHIFPEAQ